MHGVSKISTVDDVMLISYSDVNTYFMSDKLNTLAQAGVVVDMISQTAPLGNSIRFAFTASFSHLDSTIKALGGDGKPMISGGYSKINLFGQEMVTSVGVAARALAALNAAGIEISMITTSDLDISILVRQEDVDVAVQSLKTAYQL